MVLAGDLLHLHHFRIVCAVVVHDRQHRNAVMSGRPEHSGQIHQVTVVLEIDRNPPVLPVCQRCAH